MKHACCSQDPMTSQPSASRWPSVLGNLFLFHNTDDRNFFSRIASTSTARQCLLTAVWNSPPQRKLYRRASQFNAPMRAPPSRRKHTIYYNLRLSYAPPSNILIHPSTRYDSCSSSPVRLGHSTSWRLRRNFFLICFCSFIFVCLRTI